MKKIKKRYFLIPMVWFLSTAIPIQAQHRGDNLAFQGFRIQNEGSVYAMGMGSAYTSVQGGLNSMFYNSAGLTQLDKMEISFSANSYNREWWENQVYRSNRYFVTLPFYLEGLYVPDPASNGLWDHDVFQDTSFAYEVKQPEMGKHPESKEAADWTRKISGSGVTNLALAYPLKINNKNLVLALAYSRQHDIEDFDRNDTYLVPLIGYDGYEGFTPTSEGVDTTNVDWYNYLRKRSGTMHSVRTAAAYDLTKYFNIGVALNYQSGESDDYQVLDKVGYFGLFDENEFFFSYDTMLTTITGTSEFSSINAELGIIYSINRFNFGINIKTPYTMKRDWNYNYLYEDTSGIMNQSLSGQDKFEIPATYRFGMSFEPIDRFMFSVDFGWSPYSNATFKPGSSDSTFRRWPDQRTINFGIRFKALEYLDILGGYRSLSQTFVPDGAAFNGKGPDATSWTMGMGLNLNNYGQIYLAYEMRHLNYHDAYYSNTNYAVEKFNNLAIAYVYKF